MLRQEDCYLGPFVDPLNHECWKSLAPVLTCSYSLQIRCALGLKSSERNVLFQHFRKLGVGFVSEFDLSEKGIGCPHY